VGGRRESNRYIKRAGAYREETEGQPLYHSKQGRLKPRQEAVAQVYSLSSLSNLFLYCSRQKSDRVHTHSKEKHHFHSPENSIKTVISYLFGAAPNFGQVR
jgi:hypothetical protein